MEKDKLQILFGMNNFSEPSLKEEIIKHGKLIKANKNDLLIRQGQHLGFLPIVIDGKVRVYQEKEDREILLYYVSQGQTCMMSLSSAYFDHISSANGMAVEPSEILVLPTRLIAEWQLKYQSWNRFIIHTFRSRYDELLSAFGSVAFNPIEIRIKQYLLEASQQEGKRKIHLSHQYLANELGTTRVVVSRILKQFEKENKIKIYRGAVELRQM